MLPVAHVPVVLQEELRKLRRRDAALQMQLADRSLEVRSRAAGEGEGVTVMIS